MRKHLGHILAAAVVLFSTAGALAAQDSAAAPGEVLVAVLPVVGSTPGAYGSYFKTAVQVHNPTGFPFAYRLVFHPAGRSGSAADPSHRSTIGPFSTQYFADMLPAMGVASGLGSLDVFLPSGTQAAGVSAVRVFNDAGEAGTSGFTEDFVALDSVIGTGQEGYLLAPPDFTVYRFNVGVRTLDQGATLRITVRNSDGVPIRTFTKTYDPSFFEQIPVGSFLGGTALSGNECLAIEVTQGAAVVYGATTDNRTNDPSYQQARKLVD